MALFQHHATLSSVQDDNDGDDDCEQRWFTTELFKPETWGTTVHAPFLDVLAAYLDVLVNQCYDGEQMRSWNRNVASPVLDANSRVTAAATAGHRVTEPVQTLNTTLLEIDSGHEDKYSLPTCGPNALSASALMPCHVTPHSPHMSPLSSSGAVILQDASCTQYFLGQNPPIISFAEYILRLAQYSGCSTICFFYALSYIERMQGHVEISKTTAHRCASPTC